jgi:trehalose-phosphatase
MKCGETMNDRSYRAAILDLDGVMTRTASVHARAWKEMFDAFLQSRPARPDEDRSPFSIEYDYARYVDGKPRFDGVRSFLDSRGIELPEGDDGSAHDDTIRGLGDRKNEIFLALLEREPVQVYGDAVEQVGRWRVRGLPVALITSSRNGRRILASAGLEGLFDVIVDGVDSERLGIAGKPAPDIFLHAARELGVEPAEAIVVEDAIAGVEAGRAGGFGLVVGVARNGGDGLSEAGADIVVRDLRQLDEDLPRPAEGALGAEAAEEGPNSHRPSGLARIDEIFDRLGDRRLALFLDYDGTLTPIVRRPEEATLTPRMREMLRRLADRVFVAIVSGRDLEDVRRMVGLEDLHYAGSHGYDVAGPDGLRMEQEGARDFLPDLDSVQRRLEADLADVAGAWVERKRFAIAVHFREAAIGDEERVERIVDEARTEHPRLRKKGGKKIFELQPDVPWDKGAAVRWLLERLDLAGPEVLPVYIGDDVTDEDAFRVLEKTGIGVRVGPSHEPTRAHYTLRDTAELETFFDHLLRRMPGGE